MQPAPATPRRRTPRRLAAGILLATVLTSSIYTSLTLAGPPPAATAIVALPSMSAANPTAVQWPEFGRGAVGALGFDGILDSHGPTDSFPIASITKVITALVVLSVAPLKAGEDGPDITMTEADVDHYFEAIAENGSNAPVVAGTVLTERQLLEAMMLPSANNYSVTLAEWAFGSVERYLEAANAWLLAHNLTGTTVTNTSGIGPSNTSTTQDLVALGSLALAHPVLSEVTALTESQLPGAGTIRNLNTLLGIEGIFGIKTGTDDESGACILFAATIPVGTRSVTVVGVILGADSRAERDSAALGVVRSISAGFHEAPLITAGEVVGTYQTPWGQRADLVATESVSVLLWQDATVTTTAETSPITTVTQDTRVGTLTFSLPAASSGGARTVDVPLHVTSGITYPDPWWRLTHP
ncbi:D-alanyl-D-alanine carboxypeptidase (penicillin-binding protein 5/6) [Plantibacter flavus]|uniref:D-alanyl-D-alanine carboxypeptidase (Penicillin-binding protein 5/6) n=1 Tax=Plantibacter flavus TaxID=150123 RepID=A0A3N2BXN3_9MICO|nr:D-alanyl-D-alanine carboxypeptidase [Plantibacter flavus]ROR79996.1 D-alanyl-D-alanine carboxypeptidase (penicillin-binding protein 5/6) [Plantibacter flavus]SMG28298.1 D-alanyl-D-alanine carboxypeptidase (penicillin-binding protein 5/6) [Plantibacter flavus]